MVGASKPGVHIREFERGDASKGIIESLSHLTDMGGLTPSRAEELLQKMTSDKDLKLFVALNDEGAVVGVVTLLIEQKLIHNGCKIGRVEDLAVRKEHAGRGMGSALMKAATDYAKRQGCYRVILDCVESLVPFYEKFGFKKHGVEMRLDFHTGK